jgi:hypothetical protein
MSSHCGKCETFKRFHDLLFSSPNAVFFRLSDPVLWAIIETLER